MHFYIPNLKAKVLDENQSAHLFVMRIQENKTYKASDLDGKVCKVLITKVDKKTKTVEFEQVNIPKQVNFATKVMFQAVPDKVYLDKLCEVLPLTGVTNLFLFYSENSIKYPLNQDRITKILIRSCEQAEVAYLPKIVLLNKQDLETELQKYSPVVLDCTMYNTLSFVTEVFTPLTSPSHSQTNKPALVGPEGGWSEHEIQYFQSLNLSFISLGAIIYPAWIAGLIWNK